MDIVLFIVGIFFLWKGQMQFTAKSPLWPKDKRIGRAVGAVLLVPFLFEMIVIYWR